MKFLPHILLTLFISSCSSIAFWDNQEDMAEDVVEEPKERRGFLDTLTFWDNDEDEIDPSEPKSLVDISNNI